MLSGEPWKFGKVSTRIFALKSASDDALGMVDAFAAELAAATPPAAGKNGSSAEIQAHVSSHKLQNVHFITV